MANTPNRKSVKGGMAVPRKADGIIAKAGLDVDDDLDNDVLKLPGRTEVAESHAAWGGMPSFEMADHVPQSRCIQVFCERPEDVEALSKTLGIEITAKTKAVWFPPRTREKRILAWVDEQSAEAQG